MLYWELFSIGKKIRLYICKQLSNRKLEVVIKTIIKILGQFPSKLVKTITCNRSKKLLVGRKCKKNYNV